MMIKILKRCTRYAEDKDQARNIRDNIIKPSLNKGDSIVLDFSGVETTTQSFIHALINVFFQEEGEALLGKFEFRGCNKIVKAIITAVIDYSIRE